jgi:hypothetical protein
MQKGEKMKEIQFKLCLYSGIHVFLYSFKTISISCSFVKIRGYVRPFLCRFGTCLIPVWYRFVSISIGIFPYVFLPQTSFLNQKRRKAPVSDFLNFVIFHLPGVQVPQNAVFPSNPGSACPLALSAGSEYSILTPNIQETER